MFKIRISIILLGIILSLTLVSCNRAKQKGRKLIDRTQEVLENKIDELINENLEFHKTSFIKEFGEPNHFKINHQEGIWFDMPLGFYYGFLKYEANSDSIMNYISNIETNLPDISNTSFSPTDTNQISSNTKHLKDQYGQKLNGELDFFEDYKKLKSFKIYQCNRYPKSHILIVDEKSGIIYHHFEKIWD